MKKLVTLAQIVLSVFVVALVLFKLMNRSPEAPAPVVESKPISELPIEVDAYFRAITEFQVKKATLETAFHLGNQAMQALGSVLNDLSEENLRKARERMPGFDLNPNTETVLIHPEPDYFLKLAKTSALPADESFFKLFKETSPDGVSPSYLEEEPESTSCTVYNGTLVKLFGHWQEFKQAYPGSYQKDVNRKIQNIVDVLADDDCACDSKEKVTSELKAFLAVPSEANFRERVASKLKSVEAGTAKIRFDCPLEH